MNIDLVSYVPILVLLGIALIVVLVILGKILVNVGAREIAIKERRYVGHKMPPGRVVATEGEVGIQADVLKPGLHLVKWPFEKVVRKVPLIEIGPDELGIVEAIGSGAEISFREDWWLFAGVAVPEPSAGSDAVLAALRPAT